MKFAFLILLSLAGCQSYESTQIQLIDSARKGVASCIASIESDIRRVDDLHNLQIKQLDDAFDADVSARQNPDKLWLVEHRKAYAVGLRALTDQRLAAQKAKAADLKNLQAVDGALLALRRIHVAEQNILEGAKP